MVKEKQVNICPSSLPIFVRLSRSCSVSVEIVQQTGHLIQSLLVAIDVGHCHHILPLTVQVEGIAVADQRRIRIYLERIGSSHHITRNRDGDAQSILFELHKGLRFRTDISCRKHAIGMCHVVPKCLHLQIYGLIGGQRQYIGMF